MSLFQEYSLIINDLIIRLVSGLTIVIIGMLIGRFIGKLTYKILNELELDIYLAKKFSIVVDLERIISKSLQYIIYAISLFYGLNKLGLSILAIYIIVSLTLIVILLFLILEIKDYIVNWFIGYFIIDRESLKIGQQVKIRSIEGEITKITPTEIRLITTNKDTFFIPNAILSKSPLFNKNLRKD